MTRDVTLPSENDVTYRPPPAGLGSRGLDLWGRMSGLDFSPAHLVLLGEACRTADTLERLNAQLEGADWLELARSEAEDGELRVVVNGLLAERRQQQTVFRLMVAELRLSGRVAPAAGKPGAGAPEEDSPAADEGGGSGVTDLAAWVNAQRTATSEG